MSKRYLALILCLLMAGSACSCGGDAPTNDTTEATPSSTGNASESTAIPSGVPADVDFDGETVTIMHAWYHEKYTKLLNVTEESGDNVSDAIYIRNRTVEENLNVNIEIEDVQENFSNDMLASSMLRQSILAGDQAWDIVINSQFRSVVLTTEDLMYDLIDAPYIDVSKPWWYGEYMKSVNVTGKHRYMLSGDFSLNFLHQVAAIYYNKTLFENYYQNPDSLYDEVLEGSWTIDRFHELTSDVYEDLNGNSKADYEDRVGLVVDADAFPSNLMFYSAGAKLVETDNDGTISLITDIKRNANIMEKIYKLMYENSGCVQANDFAEATDVEFPQKFSDGNVMFIIGQINTADLLRDMKDPYGILPLPKYDASDDGYRSFVQDHAATLSVPKNAENIDMIAAVIEEMTYQGYMIMVPEYYSVALKTKYMFDTDDKAMQVIDIVHDSIATDIGFVHSYNMGDIHNIPRWLMRDGSTDYASSFASYQPAAVAGLKSLLEYYNQ